ncbi:MAG: type I toxin-antitoxin system Fst family toxin [Staphylococcus epidermidis]|nr:type I toxin-antitoxin system Fst family toxin [Staphylococcus epidermidis]
MFSTLFVTIIAPIIVGVILTLFSHWLNNREKEPDNYCE